MIYTKGFAFWFLAVFFIGVEWDSKNLFAQETAGGIVENEGDDGPNGCNGPLEGDVMWVDPNFESSSSFYIGAESLVENKTNVNHTVFLTVQIQKTTPNYQIQGSSAVRNVPHCTTVLGFSHVHQCTNVANGDYILKGILGTIEDECVYVLDTKIELLVVSY